MKVPRKFEPAVLQAIAQRLAETAGIEPSMLDARRVEWTVERRSKLLHLVDGMEYIAFLDARADELADLVDELTIQETCFFRDTAVFEQIAEWVRGSAYTAEKPLRVLSAPCSTGQEAYSLGATFSDAGLPLHSFVIDAVDLSSKAIAYARTGVYPEVALKHASPGQASACGELRSQRWHMHQALRDRIHFEPRNLIQPDALADKPGYHLILCRNLVIYLHASARAVLGCALAQALLPGGRLIIGAADRVRELDAHFGPSGPASAFAFIHKEHGAQKNSIIAAPAAEICVPESAEAAPTARLRAPVNDVETASVPATASEFYRRAHEHYIGGNFRKAERRCRQALYLAPDYMAALELLQKLWQLNPNLRLRRALRERIRRACFETSLARSAATRAPFTAEGGSA